MIQIRASLLFALLLPVALHAQEPRLMDRDGTLLEQTPCPSYPRSYERWLRGTARGYEAEAEEARRLGVAMQPVDALIPHLLTREEFEQRKAYQGFECRHLTYLSDGLRVTGYLWKPKDTAGKKLPLIVFNRGGNREFGRLSPWEEEGFYSYVSKGFVVIGTQYRGVDGGEGREEFGGAEIHDVLNLLPLAKSLGYVDMDNVFLLGVSRGGMETYLVLKNGIPVRAAAVAHQSKGSRPAPRREAQSPRQAPRAHPLPAGQPRPPLQLARPGSADCGVVPAVSEVKRIMIERDQLSLSCASTTGRSCLTRSGALVAATSQTMK